MNNEPTISDVLDAIGDFSTKVDGRFERIESDIANIKSKMVTKDYLDDKLINLKTDLTIVLRKEDHKLEALTRLLASKKVISEADANGILSLEPFPQNI